MDNPNSYNDDAYTSAVGALQDTIADLWNAGADETNLADELSNALENATGERCRVTITPA
jgi:prophage DNA circulation protein